MCLCVDLSGKIPPDPNTSAPPSDEEDLNITKKSNKRNEIRHVFSHVFLYNICIYFVIIKWKTFGKRRSVQLLCLQFFFLQQNQTEQMFYMSVSSSRGSAHLWNVPTHFNQRHIYNIYIICIYIYALNYLVKRPWGLFAANHEVSISLIPSTFPEELQSFKTLILVAELCNYMSHDALQPKDIFPPNLTL